MDVPSPSAPSRLARLAGGAGSELRKAEAASGGSGDSEKMMDHRNASYAMLQRGQFGRGGGSDEPRERKLCDARPGRVGAWLVWISRKGRWWPWPCRRMWRRRIRRGG